MKFAFFPVLIVLSACGPSEIAIQTEVAQTATAGFQQTMTAIPASSTPLPTRTFTPTLTATTTPTLTSTPTATATPTFTITFPPPPPVFQVTRVRIRTDQGSYGGLCEAGVTVSFTITFSVSGSGTVKYQVKSRSGKVAGLDTFDSPGDHKVKGSIRVAKGYPSGKTGHWVQVLVFSPNSITSSKANFSVQCFG